MRRGDVRSALLVALLDRPAHGYELINVLEAKSGGRWRPSPGSVYPTLQLLADEGLVTSAEQDGRRVFEISEDGRLEAAARVKSNGYPWEVMDGDVDRGGLRSATRDLHVAAKQVGISGSESAVLEATKIVKQARKDLYRLLADS